MVGTYCVAIHVPLYTDGLRVYAASEWARALALLRDSFEGAFDRFIVVAPSRPVDSTDAVLEPIGTGDDGFDPRPSLLLDGGKRDYWLHGGRRQWRQDVRGALAEADVAHLGLGDLYRPINRDALLLALARPVTSVFVRDTDETTKIRDLIAAGLMRPGPDRTVYLWAYRRAMIDAVARADLALLKGRTLLDVYGPDARNPQMFHDTSYRSDEIVPTADVDARLAARTADTPMRLVYCGRLVARKGCDHAIDIVARAAASGANVTLDFIGSGNQRPALETQVGKLGMGDRIRFLGEMSYGPGLLKTLSGYDALFFTPLSEDTPRMIFDGYAAGLPLVGYDIPYVQERIADEAAGLLLPSGKIDASAAVLAKLAADPGELVQMTQNALRAARDNATDVWYARRAAWTLEAHDRKRHE